MYNYYLYVLEHFSDDVSKLSEKAKLCAEMQDWEKAIFYMEKHINSQETLVTGQDYNLLGCWCNSYYSDVKRDKDILKKSLESFKKAYSLDKQVLYAKNVTIMAGKSFDNETSNYYWNEIINNFPMSNDDKYDNAAFIITLTDKDQARSTIYGWSDMAYYEWYYAETGISTNTYAGVGKNTSSATEFVAGYDNARLRPEFVDGNDYGSNEYSTKATIPTLTKGTNDRTGTIPTITTALRYRDWYINVRIFDNAGNSYVFSILYEFDTTSPIIESSTGPTITGINIEDDDPSKNTTANNQATIVYTYTYYDKWLYNDFANDVASTSVSQDSTIDLSKVSIVFCGVGCSSYEKVISGSGQYDITKSDFAARTDSFVSYINGNSGPVKVRFAIKAELVSGRTPTNGITIKYIKFTFTITEFTMVDGSKNAIDGCAKMFIEPGFVTDYSGNTNGNAEKAV